MSKTQGQTQPTDRNIVTIDVTTNDVSTLKHGFAPKLPNVATSFLDGTGAYSVPAGSGTSIGLSLMIKTGNYSYNL